MLVVGRERFAQQLAIHAHFARQDVSRLLQADPGFAQSTVDLITQLGFQITQRAVFVANEQQVQLATTLTRLAERGEDAVRGERALVHGFDVVGAHGGALPAHLRDQIVKQFPLADQRVMQCLKQRCSRRAVVRRGVWSKQGGRHQRAEGAEFGAMTGRDAAADGRTEASAEASAGRPRRIWRYTAAASPVSQCFGVSAARC